MNGVIDKEFALCYGHLNIAYQASCDTCPIDKFNKYCPFYTRSHNHIVRVLPREKDLTIIDIHLRESNERAHQKYLLELIEQERENPERFLKNE